MISYCPDCGGMRSRASLGNVPVTTIERTSLTRWCSCSIEKGPDRLIKYRTSDGLWHLWTQEEIDAYIEQSLTTPVVPTSRFEDESMDIHEEALFTIDMLHDTLHHRRPHTLDHEEVQDLLSRIDVMTEPLKEMVQQLEVDATVQNAIPVLRRMAREAQSSETQEGGFAVE